MVIFGATEVDALTRTLAIVGAATGLAGLVISLAAFVRDRPRLIVMTAVEVNEGHVSAFVEVANLGRQRTTVVSVGIVRPWQKGDRWYRRTRLRLSRSVLAAIGRVMARTSGSSDWIEFSLEVTMPFGRAEWAERFSPVVLASGERASAVVPFIGHTSENEPFDGDFRGYAVDYRGRVSLGTARLHIAAEPMKEEISGLVGMTATTEPERKAAWEMYVEIVTHLPAIEAAEQEGGPLLDVGVKALGALSDRAIELLRAYPPEAVFLPAFAKPRSVSPLQQLLLGLASPYRDFVQAYEAEAESRSSASTFDLESTSPDAEELRKALGSRRQELARMKDVLARAAGVEPVTSEGRETTAGQHDGT